MTSLRDEFVLVMNVPNSASAGTQKGPAPTAPSAGAGPVPLAVPVCEWALGCDKVAVDHRLCRFHADKCRDIITEHERGDLEDEL